MRFYECSIEGRPFRFQAFQGKGLAVYFISGAGMEISVIAEEGVYTFIAADPLTEPLKIELRKAVKGFRTGE